MSLYPPTVVIPVYVVFTTVGVSLTALRYYARLVRAKSVLGPDDYLITFGVAINIACTGIQVYNSLKGTGGNAITDEDAQSRVEASRKVDFVMVFIEKFGFGAVKLSLLFFYKRIFDVLPTFRRANNIAIGIVSAWIAGFATADLTICRDELWRQWTWDQSGNAQQCGDKGLLLLLFAITSVLTDLMVLGLPFFILPKLQMARRAKWGAATVFLLGFTSTLAAILRSIFLCIAYPTGRMRWNYKAPPGVETPLVLQVFNPTFWVMVELCLGVWAANLPALGPMIRNMKVTAIIGSTLGSMYRRMSYARTSRSRSKSKSKSKSRTETVKVSDMSSSQERIHDGTESYSIPMVQVQPSINNPTHQQLAAYRGFDPSLTSRDA